MGYDNGAELVDTRHLYPLTGHFSACSFSRRGRGVFARRSGYQRSIAYALNQSVIRG